MSKFCVVTYKWLTNKISEKGSVLFSMWHDLLFCSLIQSLAERVASSYSLWKVAVVCAYVSRVSVYLPHTSLFSSTPRTMEGNLKAALQSSSSPLHAVVIKLASVTLHCGNCKQDIDQYTADLPVRLPPSLWAQGTNGLRSCNHCCINVKSNNFFS